MSQKFDDTSALSGTAISYALVFFSAHLAFIIADSFSRAAALIGLRPARFFGAAFPFLCAHRAFIIADNFFRMAALIGLRPADFLETGATFLGSGLAFRFAHQAFFAAAILARAAGLMRRRFGRLGCGAGAAC
jgi:hypothetical protein